MKEIIINSNFHILKSLIRDYHPHSFVYSIPKEYLDFLSEEDIKDGNIFNIWKEDEKEWDTQIYKGIGILKIKNGSPILVSLIYDKEHMPFETVEEAKKYYNLS